MHLRGVEATTQLGIAKGVTMLGSLQVVSSHYTALLHKLSPTDEISSHCIIILPYKWLTEPLPNGRWHYWSGSMN